jgi:hypothetical protein
MVVATRLSIIYLIVIVQTAELAKECINTRPVFPWAQSIAFLTRRQFYKRIILMHTTLKKQVCYENIFSEKQDQFDYKYATF